MSSHTTTPVTQTSAAAVVCLGLGLVAALLTTILGYISLVAGAGALIAGALSWRRQGPSVRAAAGMSMAAVSIYVILLEIFVVG